MGDYDFSGLYRGAIGAMCFLGLSGVVLGFFWGRSSVDHHSTVTVCRCVAYPDGGAGGECSTAEVGR